ncbi:MAG: flagellar basal body P-ring protein FlgI [Gammaproteobacteria bacterium]
MKKIISHGIVSCLLLSFLGTAQAERIKDLTHIAGVRSNQLIGYGLVVGLDGTGDQTSQTPFTVQSMKSMLQQFGITVPPNVNPQLKNVAAVAVHADLPAFSKLGQTIDITASSIGNSKSLRGGTLLMTPLKGADGKVYAIGQGDLLVSGLNASGGDGSSITVNIPSVGRIPNGASVERVVKNSFMQEDSIVLNLNESDFTTANRLSKAINMTLGPDIAHAIDATSIKVNAPKDSAQRVAFASLIENIEVEPGDASARVIINSRTGTVVIGKNVRIEPAAVSHGSLIVTISENPEVSQPEAFANGQTVVNPQTDIDVVQEDSRMFVMKSGTTLDDVVRAVNRVGAGPSDLVAILEALKHAGALRAELIVI